MWASYSLSPSDSSALKAFGQLTNRQASHAGPVDWTPCGHRRRARASINRGDTRVDLASLPHQMWARCGQCGVRRQRIASTVHRSPRCSPKHFAAEKGLCGICVRRESIQRLEQPRLTQGPSDNVPNLPARAIADSKVVRSPPPVAPVP